MRIHEIQMRGVVYVIDSTLGDGDLDDSEFGAVRCNRATFEAVRRAVQGYETAFAPVLDRVRIQQGTFTVGLSEFELAELMEG